MPIFNRSLRYSYIIHLLIWYSSFWLHYRKNLLELFLGSNSIRFIPEDYFRKCPGLRVVEININALTVMPNFEPLLLTLTRLNLGQNQIKQCGMNIRDHSSLEQMKWISLRKLQIKRARKVWNMLSSGYLRAAKKNPYYLIHKPIYHKIFSKSINGNWVKSCLVDTLTNSHTKSLC